MTKRKALTINNGASNKRTKLFNRSGLFYAPKQQKDDASIFNYARSGRQNSEGFGGGNRVGNRMGR